MCCVPGLVLAISMFLLPETPPYLLRKKKMEKAVESLSWLTNKPMEDSKQELLNMKNSQNETCPGEDKTIFVKEILSR